MIATKFLACIIFCIVCLLHEVTLVHDAPVLTHKSWSIETDFSLKYETDDQLQKLMEMVLLHCRGF